jgi:glycosyltransferase involved in cell wall biosynthesis
LLRYGNVPLICTQYLALQLITKLLESEKLSMFEHGKVTVGIPAYNAQTTIGKPLKSALSQTWSGPMEILVVDDGSTDATEREVRRYGKQDERVRYEKLPENRGRAEARNEVLRLCGHQDVLAWLDADDEWHPQKIARQMENSNSS